MAGPLRALCPISSHGSAARALRLSNFGGASGAPNSREAIIASWAPRQMLPRREAMAVKARAPSEIRRAAMARGRNPSPTVAVHRRGGWQESIARS